MCKYWSWSALQPAEEHPLRKALIAVVEPIARHIPQAQLAVRADAPTPEQTAAADTGGVLLAAAD
jgi:hypothetical protein